MQTKITYHQDDFTQEILIGKTNENQKRIEIIETQNDGGIPQHLLISKKKDDNSVSINNIRVECKIFTLLKQLINDEF